MICVGKSECSVAEMRLLSFEEVSLRLIFLPELAFIQDS